MHENLSILLKALWSCIFSLKSRTSARMHVELCGLGKSKSSIVNTSHRKPNIRYSLGRWRHISLTKTNNLHTVDRFRNQQKNIFCWNESNMAVDQRLCTVNKTFEQKLPFGGKDPQNTLGLFDPPPSQVWFVLAALRQCQPLALMEKCLADLKLRQNPRFNARRINVQFGQCYSETVLPNWPTAKLWNDQTLPSFNLPVSQTKSLSVILARGLQSPVSSGWKPIFQINYKPYTTTVILKEAQNHQHCLASLAKSPAASNIA